MIDNFVIQADIVADLKAYSDLTDALEEGSEGIKESQYQGREFQYAAVRVHIDSNTPIATREQCDHARLIMTIRSYAEGGSSKQASQVAALVNTRFHRRNFRAATWYTWLRSAGFMGPNRVADELWMSETVFNGVIYPTIAFVTPTV